MGCKPAGSTCEILRCQGLFVSANTTAGRRMGRHCANRANYGQTLALCGGRAGGGHDGIPAGYVAEIHSVITSLCKPLPARPTA